MQNLKKYKLFARNVTARADYVVRGNPVVSRPEDGVENCFPGLEFDQRNLDKAFFPGLLFEFHHSLGVVVRELDPEGPAAAYIKSSDIEKGIFLAFLQGVFASRRKDSAPSLDVFQFRYPAGLDAWRVVRDLERGKIAIALCDRETYERLLSVSLDTDLSVTPAMFADWATRRENRIQVVPGLGKFYLLFGDRADYLTTDGVIDPILIQPGDLTRSLCSPWQYDFADCGCFYWAANKPDLVSSPEQPERVLNFQRRHRSAESDRAASSEDWVVKHNYRWDSREVILNHAEMLTEWTSLPVVLNGRESKEYTPRYQSKPRLLLSRKEVVDRLMRLAPVEHALCIEYLYAYYSLGQPMMRPAGGDAEQQRIFNAAHDVFEVAIDEMRHLRVVNEVLIELGETWVLARAGVIGEDFDANGVAFNKPYELVPLTMSQLDWFIAVEEASQNHGDADQDTIDGMYTLILRSINEGPEFSASEKERLGYLVKIIIDEGMEHYRRFSRVKTALNGIPESRYLKVNDPPERLPSGAADRVLQDVVDAAYVVVLRSLDFVFHYGDRQRGALLESARRSMFNMDDAARSLSVRGVGAIFDMSGYTRELTRRMTSGIAPLEGDLDATLSLARSVGAPLQPALDALRAAGLKDGLALAERMVARLNDMTRAFEATLTADAG
jgi:Ferritin-like